MGLAETSIEYGHTAKRDPFLWTRIVVYTLAFQIAWFWRQIPALFQQGALPDTDDFQRLTQIREWRGGQSWFDVTVYRMDPPAGAEMHWSRLVDVPIAALMSFFELFASPQMAERITAFVWPSMLLIATVLVLIGVCRKLDSRLGPLVVVLYTLTCFTALSAFQPGRLDHHSVQILLFCAMLLGIVAEKDRWAPLLIGGAIALSVAVGLDGLMLFVATLAWIGVSWAWDRRNSARCMALTGLSLLVFFPLLMVASVAPSQWLVARCDSLSIVYLCAFLLVGGAFVILPAIFRRLSFATQRRQIAARLAAGIGAGAIVAAALLALFPQCALGPYSAVSPDLASRWLNDVSEARGMLGQIEKFPQISIAVLAYSLFIVAVAAYVAKARYREQPAYVALLAILVLSVAASFLQYRALRIGIFSSIPFCVAAVAMHWDYAKARFADSRITAMALHELVIIALLAPVWLAVSVLLLPDTAQGTMSQAETKAEAPAWSTDNDYAFCNRADQYARLAALPPGYVMSDINSGAPAVVFTPHAVVGGPYHRNERAILDMVDFFREPEAAAREIARRRDVDYVAYCDSTEPLTEKIKRLPALAIAIRTFSEPDWLERLSTPSERMHLFKVRKPLPSSGE